MSTIFISHSSEDNALAAEMRERLDAQKYPPVFLDFDPKDGIPAGRDWQTEIYHKLKLCRAMIVLCSPASMASKWCFAEVTQFLAMGKKEIFPVKVATCQVDQLLTVRQTIDMTVDREEGYERLWQGLKLALRDDFPFDPAKPFPGFNTFEKGDAGVFFGREEEIGKVKDLLTLLRRLGDTQLAIVLGASGCGKSSLIRAGVLPYLARDQHEWIILEPFRPKGRPIMELAKVLDLAFGGEHKWATIRDQLTSTQGVHHSPPPRSSYLIDLLEKLRIKRGLIEATVVVTIDQLEELFDIPAKESTTSFLTLLRSVLEIKSSPLLVLGTLRSDFLGVFQTHSALSDFPFKDFLLGPMPVKNLSRVIEGPASRVGIEFEPGLIPRIVNETTNQDALPLLAITLKEMWERDKTKFTLKTYEKELGGLKGVMERVAQDIIGNVKLNAKQEQGLHQAFLKMVKVNDEGQFVRQPVLWKDLPEAAQPILERFETGRLLISKPENGERTVEVIHEALLRVWSTLAKWLENNRPFLFWRQRLRAAISQWEGIKEDKGALLRGVLLAEASRWLEEQGDQLNDQEKTFIRESQEHQVGEERKYKELYQKSLGRQLALQASELLEDPHCQEIEAAVLLAVEAYRRHPSVEAHQVLFRSLESLPLRTCQQDILFRGNNSKFLVTSPSGHYVAAACGSAQLYLYDMETCHQIRQYAFEEGWISSIGFPRNDKFIAAIGMQESQVRVWEIKNDSLVCERVFSSMNLGNLLFHPNGQMLAIMKKYGNWVKILDINTREVIATLEMGISKWPVMAFSPDGSLFAVLDESEAIIWNTSDWDQKVSLKGHSVNRLLFSPENQYLLMIRGGSFELWDIKSRTLQKSVNLGSAIDDACFNPTADTLTVASLDGKLRLYSLNPFSEIQKFDIHGQIRDLKFDCTGRYLAGCESSQLVRVWDMKFGVESERYRTQPGIQRIDFNEQGIHIIGWQKTKEHWQCFRHQGVPGPRLLRLTHQDTIWDIAISQNGDTIAYCDYESGIRVLNVNNGAVLHKVKGKFFKVCFDLSGTVLYALEDATYQEGIKIISIQSENADIDLPCPVLLGGSQIRLSGDGYYFAVNSLDNKIKTCMTQSNTECEIECVHKGFIRDFQFHAKNGSLLATVGDDSLVKIWDLETKNLKGSLKLEVQGRKLSMDPVESRLAVSGMNCDKFWIWDFANNEVLKICEHPGSVAQHCISPCGNYLATSSLNDFNVILWSFPLGLKIHPLKHFDRIRSLGFSSDGTYLLTAGDDKTARIWEVKTGKLVAQIIRQQKITSARFGPGDKWIVLRYWDTYAEIIYFRASDLISLAGQRLSRNLDLSEWQRYVEDEPYNETFSHLPESNS